MTDFHSVSALPYAFGGPCATGVIRTVPEDFVVEELPLVTPEGEGEHAFIHIEKRNSNTEWIAKQLVRLADVPPRDVSFAGLKDRNAVTRQWFSIRLAGKPEPDWTQLESDELKVLQVGRHRRKLRRGALRGNRFELCIRELAGDLDKLEKRLGLIQQQGVPNYFGEQRFGHDGENIQRAEALFSGELKRVKRHLRGIYISAVRSLLFNQVLAKRVEQGSWNSLLEGERCMLDGSTRSFHAEQLDDQLQQRLAEVDIHPSGPLWGRGWPDLDGAAKALEWQILEPLALWREGLERCGADLDRRALRAPVCQLEWRIEQDRLTLSFSLPKGSYATAVLRECLDYRNGSSCLRESNT